MREKHQLMTGESTGVFLFHRSHMGSVSVLKHLVLGSKTVKFIFQVPMSVLVTSVYIGNLGLVFVLKSAF